MRELWGLFVPRYLEDSFVLFSGYIDESYNENIFNLACLLSDGKNWWEFRRHWNKCLHAKNKCLKKEGRKQISRYHAADCSSRVGEFKGWSVSEQISFTQDLLRVFNYRFQNVISYSISLGDFKEVFPEAESYPIAACYGLMLKFIMIELGDQLYMVKERLGQIRQTHIAFIHDRSRFDAILLNAFNEMLADPNFTAKEHFTTIAPLPSENCPPLQGADLLAYETFKESERRYTGRKRRISLDILLASGKMGARCRHLTRTALMEIRNITLPPSPVTASSA
jgi:hypothetical protein